MTLNSLLVPPRAALALLIMSLGTLAAVWIFQFAGFEPCPLCLQQRWAWYAVIPVSAAIAVVQLRRPGSVSGTVGLVLAGLVLLAGAVLAGYHAGVEWKFWPGPQSCAGGAGLSGGLPDLSKARVILCDEVQGRFLGLSFAGWNVLASLTAAAIAFVGARSRDC